MHCIFAIRYSSYSNIDFYMIIEQLKFSETNYFSKLLIDYVAGRLPESVRPPFATGYEGLQQQLEIPYPLKIDRSVLREAIRRQYSEVDLYETVEQNIELFKRDNTYVIVTAHQLCLLGGPLYYVIKIANAIALVRKLSAMYPDRHFVPVYWMGSEDHDFEEINHIRLFGKTLTWQTDQQGAVGRFSLKGVEPVIEELKMLLGDKDTDGLQALITRAYSQPDMEAASRTLVNALFGKYGLVIVDGDDHVLKSAMIPVIQKELKEQFSNALVSTRSESLQKQGYHVQATPREINLFYLNGSRERIVSTESGFAAGDKSFTEAALLEELEQYPERFSPNVVLRPVFQQSVLPAIGFIGGGGEMAYWLQLPEVFKAAGVRYPVLIPRTSLLYIYGAAAKKVTKLHLQAGDLFKPKDQLKKEIVLQDIAVDADLVTEKAEMVLLMERVKKKLMAIDPTLGPAAGADSQKIQAMIEHLESRMIRALKHQNETMLKQIDSIYQSLFPDNGLQERTDNFMNLYAVQGQSFIDWLVRELQVIDHEFVVASEK